MVRASMVLDERQGPARARQYSGARHAHGDLILFLDAERPHHDDALGRVVEHFGQDHRSTPSSEPTTTSLAAEPFVSRHRNLLHCFTHVPGIGKLHVWSGCGAVRRETFLRHGGFDERYGRPAIEDIEFGARLKSAGGRIRSTRRSRCSI